MMKQNINPMLTIPCKWKKNQMSSDGQAIATLKNVEWQHRDVTSIWTILIYMYDVLEEYEVLKYDVTFC